MRAELARAMAITARLNRLTFADADEVRSLFGELTGKPIDDGFLLIPPFYATGGAATRIGRNVFVNQNCTFYDLGGLDIGDDAMIGPNVSLITSGHPLEPSRRRDAVVARPISIGNNVDRRGRDDPRRRDGRRERGGRRRLGRDARRPAGYAGRRQPGADRPFDRGVTAWGGGDATARRMWTTGISLNRNAVQATGEHAAQA
jgi:hypothetical protein